MYNILKNVIDRGEYNLSSIVSKADKLWVEDKLTEEQRDELVNMARAGAKTEYSVDVFTKLIELEQRIKALEEGKTDTNTAETIEEYVIGKWYYTGNKALFNGKVYECIAPAGVVCTWSPTEYPAYWKQIN